MAFHNIPPNGFPDIPDMEELEAVVKDVNNLSDNKANQITIAPFFNPEASYEVGDLVYYNGLSYRCTNDHEGEWDVDDFAATTVSGELATLKSGLTSKSEAITDGVFSSLLVKRCADIESISGEYVTAGQALSANTWATIATVSSDYRPKTDRYLSAYICGANGALLASARLTVKANGEISFCPSANIASGTAVFFVVTFVI